MKETNIYGFFLKAPTERIYQTIKVGKFYEQGTLFFVDTDEDNGSVDFTELPAFTITDSSYVGGVSKYVGIVAAVEGLTVSSGGKMTICADAEVDIDAYNEKEASQISKNGSSTLGLPFHSPNSKVCGFGTLKLTKVKV